MFKLTNWCLAAPAQSRQKVEPGILRKPYSELCPDTRCFQDWTCQVRRRWLEMSVTRCKWEIGFCHLEMTRLQSGSPFAPKCADVRTRANPQFQKISQFLFCQNFIFPPCKIGRQFWTQGIFQNDTKLTKWQRWNGGDDRAGTVLLLCCTRLSAEMRLRLFNTKW